MPADVKPLFRPDAVRPKLTTFAIPATAAAARPKLAEWVKLLTSDAGKKRKETELLADFLRDVFVDLLGYVPPPAGAYSLKREALVQVDGKFADAAIGRFGGDAEQFVLMVEGKGPKDPLDIPFGGRKLSAVDQALKYAVNTPTDWYLVTNLRELRLYSKLADQRTFERFELSKLAADDAEFARFVFLLGADRLLDPAGSHLNAVLAESAKLGRELTRQFYDEYRALRIHTFDALKTYNPDRDPAALLAATQKILDRVLFIAFAEDRKLLPGDIIAKAYDQKANPFDPQPVWGNFKGLFRAVDRGSKPLDIWQYNGGLFAEDEFIDALAVPDSVCSGFKLLADYEYGGSADADAELIDVDILGHVFEQSISDLEEMQNVLAGRVAAPKANEKTSRKEAGAFYTPEFVTRYIVAETLGPVLADRFEVLRTAQQQKATKTTKKVLDDPAAFDVAALTKPQTTALTAFWGAWLEELETVRIVDPACGSGAFLLEAFDQLFEQYRRAQGFLTELSGPTLFDINKAILEHNLYGVDLNGEAVEIARLSCWIKTAEYGKVLTTLDRNIVMGNSVVSDPAFSPKAFDWKHQFPDVFAAGGFDVVIGNPPYVRQEWIKEIKPHLEQHYKAYDGTADLYVYFYELGLNLLKPGGRLGFIVTNKWLKAGYGEPLRTLYGEAAWVEQVVDFGHAKQIFPDADVFPCILVARKPSDVHPPPTNVQVSVIPREQLRIDDLSRQIESEGFGVPRERFGAAAWNLEPPAVAALMDKLRANGVPLKEFAGVGPFRGVVTGCNEAFVVDTQTRDRLVAEHLSSEAILKKYLRGQDIERWCSEWSGEWMIFARRGIDIDQYPALKRHLEQFRTQLEPKPKDYTGKDWPGRKPGSYRWYEMQDPVEYWRGFEKPKIMFQDIVWNQRFTLDTAGMYGNNTVYYLPTTDPWLMAVLNAPCSWWFAWRTAQHGKDEALRFFADYIEAFPIPRPTDETRARAEEVVKRLIDLKGGRTDGLRALLDWLQSEMKVGKVSQKLEGLIGLTAEELAAEVKKQRPGKQGLSVAELKRLKDEYAKNVVPLQALDREADHLERELSDLVNAAFGLTPADVQLMWDTAPPRMPFTRS